MKLISITPDIKNQLLEEFKKHLDESKTFDTKFKFSATLTPPKDTPRPVIIFTADAYLKASLYVRETNVEIAWHGTVTRLNDTVFRIDDVFLYPQTIAAATVNTDQDKYNDWLINLDDDTANTMRLQGHSHVNMGVGPSAVDTAFYEEILQTLPPDDYYIFMILNKKGEMTVLLYDLKTNIIYDTKDIDVKIMVGNALDILAVIEADKKEYCKIRTYQPPATQHTNYGAYGRPYGYQSGYGYGLDPIDDPYADPNDDNDVNTYIDHIYDKTIQQSKQPQNQKGKGKKK